MSTEETADGEVARKPKRKIDTVTFLATRPDWIGLEVAPDVERASFLDTVTDVLQGAIRTRGADDGEHHLVLVSDICAISDWLHEHLTPNGEPTDKRVRIQFVGHSKSGRLQLGASWIADPLTATQEPFYELNSDPGCLGQLERFCGYVEEVMLAGCNVGEWVAHGAAVNGRTLMFSLAEMWHCKVRGAITEVYDEDFVNGWYGGPVTGWSWNGSAKQRQLMIAKREEEDERDLPGVNLRSHVVLSEDATHAAPVAIDRWSGASVGGLALSSEESKSMFEYFNTRLDRELNLAAREHEVVLEYAGYVVKGYLLGGGRYLSLRLPTWQQSWVFVNGDRDSNEALGAVISRSNWERDRTRRLEKKARALGGLASSSVVDRADEVVARGGTA